MIPASDQKNLPEDENTPEKRAEKIWEFFGKKENGNWWSVSEACSAPARTHADAPLLLSHPPQIKSQRESSFRAWWTTRRSCGWYNTMSRRKLRTSWKRRSSKRKSPLRWFIFLLTFQCDGSACPTVLSFFSVLYLWTSYPESNSTEAEE